MAKHIYEKIKVLNVVKETIQETVLMVVPYVPMIMSVQIYLDKMEALFKEDVSLKTNVVNRSQ